MRSLTRIFSPISFILLAFPFSRGAAQSVVLSAGAATGVAGESTSISISVTSSGGAQAAALEWTLAYPANTISTVTVAPGAAAVAAGKTVTCSPEAGGLICLAYGMNSNPFPDGDIADATILLSSAFTSGSAAIQVGGSVAASAEGGAIVSTGSSGAITNAPTSLSSLTCSPIDVNTPGSLTCQATISALAPSGGLAIAISDNSVNLILPTGMTIPAGSTSASFSGTVTAPPSSQTAVITVSANGTSQSTTVTLSVAPLVSELSCSPTSLLSNATAKCGVTISHVAAVPTPVYLASSDPVFSIPASVSIPAGSSSASFIASAGTISTNQSVTITASLNNQSATVMLSLVAPPPLGQFICMPEVILSGSPAECTVSLSSPAPLAGTAVEVVSSNASVIVPPLVTVAAGGSNATFTAVTVSSVTDQMAWITATGNGVSQSLSLLAAHTSSTQMNLLLRGQATETSGMKTGASVTPSASLPQVTGTVVVNGAGSVNFVQARAGAGVFFQSCCTNASNAYYQFTGASVGSLFNTNQGQVSFYLTSRYSFAQRTSNAALSRYAFDVQDANGHLYYFLTQVASGFLQFTYMMAGTSQYYYVPQGTEDTLFGEGVSMKITLAWDGSNMNLYLNDTLVKTGPYPKPAPNWTAASLFDFGAKQYLTFGGYNSSDDIISDFVVTGPSGQGN